MKRSRTICFFLLFMATAMSESAVAQHRNDGNVARIVFHQELSQSASPSPDLKSALESLRKETQQLQETTKRTERIDQAGAQREFSSQRPSIMETPSGLRPSPTTSSSLDEIGDTSDIVERIELLKRIYEQKRLEKQARITKAKLELPVPAPSEPDQSAVASPSETKPANLAAPKNPMRNQLDDPKQTLSSSTDANRVFSDPVDMFELGNSLYQTGEVQAALEAYLKVDRSTITVADGVWLDFMTASCYRQLGNWGDATKMYRGVANQNAAPNLAEPAQRWIEHLDVMSRSKSKFTQMETEINSLVETAKKHVKP